MSGEYDSTSSITSNSTTTTATHERRQSLVRVSSPRHHPYMSPGKVYTPSIMSTLQSYRQQPSDYSTTKNNDDLTTTENELDHHHTTDVNRPW
jgi:hypothetical protein